MDSRKCPNRCVQGIVIGLIISAIIWFAVFAGLGLMMS